MRKQFLGTVLILLIAAALQFVFGETFGVWINFALAALVAAAFFLDPLRLSFPALLAIFLLNAKPAFSYEMLFIAVFPFLVLRFREALPWHRWLSAAFFTFLGIAAMYAIFAPKFFLDGAQLLFIDVLVSALFAIAAFKTIKNL